MAAGGAPALAHRCGLFAAALVALAACRGPTPGEANTMQPDNAQFLKVALNSREAQPCSPKPPAGSWRGLLIQAPTQVSYKPGERVDGQFAAIPLCGFYQLDLLALQDDKPLMLVAVDQANGQTYRGPVLDEDAGNNEPQPGPQKVDPALLAGMSTSSYFNPNLARYVRLPERAAQYSVHAEFGGMQSNSVTVDLVLRR